MKRCLILGLLAIAIGISTLAQAENPCPGTLNLFDRGNGLIWDPDRGITWYNFTYTGPLNTGATWDQANAWAAGLTAGGQTGWRLPSTVDGQYIFGWDGTTTGGYNITTSEMGHLFYTELGNKGYYDVKGNYQAGYYGLSNTGPFTNLLPSLYWSGAEYALNSTAAWCFTFFDGSLNGDYPKGVNDYALAVHSGDVGAPVPIPGTILLFAPGLVGLAALRRGFKK